MILLSLSIFCLLLGWYSREILERLKRIERGLANLIHKDAPPTTRASSILEPPLTPAERVQREQEEILERLNPQL